MNHTWQLPAFAFPAKAGRLWRSNRLCMVRKAHGLSATRGSKICQTLRFQAKFERLNIKLEIHSLNNDISVTAVYDWLTN